MPTVSFSKTADTGVHDGTNYVTENGIYWALLNKDVTDVASIDTVVESGTNLDLSGGEGTLTAVTATAGTYILLLQSNTTEQVGSYIVTLAA